MISSSCPAQRWAQHTAQPAVLLLCILAALCTLAHPAAAAIPFQQAPVDWTLAPDTPEAAANLSTSCICALLNGTCTPGCCCDTACPVELLQSFKDAGQCLPEGTPPQQLPYCIPAEPFAKASMCCEQSGLHHTGLAVCWHQISRVQTGWCIAAGKQAAACMQWFVLVCIHSAQEEACCASRCL